MCWFLTYMNMDQPSVQFSSVAQSCPTLCDPMNQSTPGLPVHHHQLLEFTQTHCIKSVMLSSHLILCCPLLLLSPIPPSIRVLCLVDNKYSKTSTIVLFHIISSTDSNSCLKRQTESSIFHLEILLSTKKQTTDN